MNALASFTPIGRGLIVAAAVALLILFLKMAAPFIAPILLAAFIAVVAAPALHWMRQHGVPKWGGLLIVAFVLLDAGSLLALVATGALEGFRDSLPGFQERFLLLSEQAGLWLEALGMPGSREAIPDILDPAKAAGLVKMMLANASGVFGTGLLVLLAVVFILLEAPTLSAKLKAAFHLTEESEARLARVMQAMSQYIKIKGLASLAVAVLIWIWTWKLGLPFAALWGVLAFFLNFIPFLGNLLMAIPPVLLALVQTDLQTTLLVALGYLVVNFVVGNILEPRFMGKGLGISTLAVFLSLLFWGWVLGLVGVFLAVPLTMALIIALDASPQTRAFAILLGPTIVESAEEQSHAVPSETLTGMVDLVEEADELQPERRGEPPPA